MPEKVDARKESPGGKMGRKKRKNVAVETSTISLPLKLGQVIHTKPDRKKETSLFLPRPWKRHKHDILQQRIKKLQNLDDSMKKSEFSEKDERVKTVPFGCLSFHILELHNISASVSDYEASAPLFYYGVITIGKIRRITKYVQSATPSRVRMDSVSLFSCELSEWRENYRNKMKIEIWTFQDPNNHFIIGSVQLHLFNFIHHIHGIDSRYIWGDGILRGKIIFEYAFAYGSFGYGHSTQFRNTDVPILESVSHSMFPRIQLDEGDIAESRYNTYLPAKIKLMTLNSFVMEKSEKKGQVGGGEGDELLPKTVTLKQVEFEKGHPVHCKVHMPIYQEEIKADFCDAYGDFLCISKRSDRIEFCRRLVEGRTEDIREDEYATELFNSLPKENIQKILEEPAPAGEILNDRPCVDGHGAVTYEEDEPLLNMFPCTDRSSGYLGRLFGLGGEHEPGDKRPDFPLEELQGRRRQHKPQMSLHLWVRYLWSRCGALLSWIKQQVVPDRSKHSDVPEISVTLPSPDISTTDLCALWLDPDSRRKLLNEEQILRQEAHRFNLPAEDEPPEGPGTKDIQDKQTDGPKDQGDHGGSKKGSSKGKRRKKGSMKKKKPSKKKVNKKEKK